MTTQPRDPVPPPASQKRPRGPMMKLLLVVLIALLLLSVVLGVVKLVRAPAITLEERPAHPAAQSSEPQQAASAEGSTVSGAPDQTTIVELPAPSAVYEPAFWLDVLKPKPVHQALTQNPWVTETARQPVGRGFLGPWAVFFGTRGQDTKTRFDGLVLELFTGALLGDPYRVLWLTGEKSAHVPLVVVPEASDSALAALGTLVAAAGQGGFAPQGCQAEAGATERPKTERPKTELDTIHRLVLGDQALFVARAGKRLVVSMRPHAVLLGLCLEPIVLEAGANAVELGVALNQNGRALQGLATVLGLGPQATLALGIDGVAFVPRGLVAELASPGRLAAGALEESMLKLVPEPTSVFFTFALSLPERLDATMLKAQISGAATKAPLVRRQLAVLWNPRGDAERASEVAVIWSRLEDEPFLESILSKSHPLLQKRLCGHVVLASTPRLLNDLEATCSGSSPSVLSAAPLVAKGLKEPSSVGVSVNLGAMLSQLLLDGFTSDPASGRPAGSQATPPPEIEAARRQLEALPFLHWRAVVDDKGRLIPEGFRS